MIDTHRLRLREMRPDDLDFIAEMLAHPEVMRFYPKLLNREESQAWLQRQWDRYARFGHGLWMVEDRSNQNRLGQVGLLMQEVDGILEPEIGYLIHQPYWRKGYALEAALSVKEYAFQQKGFPHVISLIRPENIPSQGVAKKLGMQPIRETLFREIPHWVFRLECPFRHEDHKEQ